MEDEPTPPWFLAATRRCTGLMEVDGMTNWYIVRLLPLPVWMATRSVIPATKSDVLLEETEAGATSDSATTTST